jgi:hypothetical protein
VAAGQSAVDATVENGRLLYEDGSSFPVNPWLTGEDLACYDTWGYVRLDRGNRCLSIHSVI